MYKAKQCYKSEMNPRPTLLQLVPGYSVSNQTSLPNETSQTPSAQPPVNKQKTFTITYSGTKKYRNDTSIKAQASRSFQLILDNEEEIEDSMNYGKVKGLGYVNLY